VHPSPLSAAAAARSPPGILIAYSVTGSGLGLKACSQAVPKPTALSWYVTTLRLPEKFPTVKVGLPGQAGKLAWGRGDMQCGSALPAAPPTSAPVICEVSQRKGLVSSCKLIAH